eukprot:263977-Rhodomonas_salina.7
MDGVHPIHHRLPHFVATVRPRPSTAWSGVVQIAEPQGAAAPLAKRTADSRRRPPQRGRATERRSVGLGRGGRGGGGLVVAEKLLLLLGGAHGHDVDLALQRDCHAARAAKVRARGDRQDLALPLHPRQQVRIARELVGLPDHQLPAVERRKPLDHARRELRGRDEAAFLWETLHDPPYPVRLPLGLLQFGP